MTPRVRVCYRSMRPGSELGMISRTPKAIRGRRYHPATGLGLRQRRRCCNLSASNPPVLAYLAQARRSSRSKRRERDGRCAPNGTSACDGSGKKIYTVMTRWLKETPRLRFIRALLTGRPSRSHEDAKAIRRTVWGRGELANPFAVASKQVPLTASRSCARVRQ